MRSTIMTALVALIAGFAGGILSQHVAQAAQAAPVAQAVVTARAFHLVDANGAILARLEPYTYSSKNPKRPMLVLYGSGEQQADVQPDGVYIGQGYGKVNIGMGYAVKNSPALFFWYQTKGRMGLMLDATTGGTPSIFMNDSSGNRTWKAP